MSREAAGCRGCADEVREAAGCRECTDEVREAAGKALGGVERLLMEPPPGQSANAR